MKQLKTEYLGLSLRNPLIVSSSGLTASLEKLQRLEAAGAGAVVLKSVFEEQIVGMRRPIWKFTTRIRKLPITSISI